MTSTPPSSHSPHNSSSASTPPRSSSPTPSFFPSSLTSSVSSLLRRISTPASGGSGAGSSLHSAPTSVPHQPPPPPPPPPPLHDAPYYTPPGRTASPFQPPPLYPLTLRGCGSTTTMNTASPAPEGQILSRALAEEIRLLLPPRLQLIENWDLAYSLENDGVSLATLYKRCAELRGVRRGYILVVKDGEGGIFGAYLTDAPHPSPHYYGTGECFLWRASIISSAPLLSSLPPPPSADTTNLQRSTTIASAGGGGGGSSTLLPPPPNPHSHASSPSGGIRSGTSTPERIRFKAFPYSGINDYLMLCESGYLSIGGGDGHYGLWLDDIFERGISSSCPTFGNEPLSDEGEKFEILGVELWFVGG
ncbi:MAG: oxidation resistance protein 1 [Thelocarpon superellum]|nr:MAG: oxidation resistance protein 1 [Thelocarpon superellum]